MGRREESYFRDLAVSQGFSEEFIFEQKQQVRQMDGKCKGPVVIGSLVCDRNSKTAREWLEPSKQGANYKR